MESKRGALPPSDLLDLAEQRAKLRRTVNRVLSTAPTIFVRPTAHGKASSPDSGYESDDGDGSDEPDDLQRLLAGQISLRETGLEWDDWEISECGDEIDPAARRRAFDDCLHPDQIQLPLPSYFPESFRASMGWNALADVELQLRGGQLRELLGQLRSQIGGRAWLYTTEWNAARGQGQITRAATRIHGLVAKISQSARAYGAARSALTALNPQATLLKEFRELRKEDLKNVRERLDHTVKGRSKEPVSWIWGADGAVLDQSSFVHECESQRMLGCIG